MTKKEQVEREFLKDLKSSMTDFFNAKSTYRGRNILNSEIVKGSVFEKSELVTDMKYDSNFSLPIGEILLGDIDRVRIDLIVRVGAVERINWHEGKLNSWSTTDFDISPIVHVEFDTENSKLVINKIELY